jgi:hypothetical protein
MSDLGYVIPPAGVYPAAFFVPGVAIVDPTRPPPVLADDITPDGDLGSLFTPVHPVDAAIKEVFRLFGDTGAAVVGKGQRFNEIRKNLPDTPRRMKDEANRILAPFVSRGDIEVLEITVDADIAPDLGALFVRYRNRRTGQEQGVP